MNSSPQAEKFDNLRSDKTILQWEIARRRRKIFEVWNPKNTILQWDLARRRRNKLRFGDLQNFQNEEN